MATNPLELAQDAVYQSYTSSLTELWSLLKTAQGLNANNNNNNNNNIKTTQVSLKSDRNKG